MTALQWIIKEAKHLRAKNPKIEWKKAVAQASAIYASKHKGKSPVGKKKPVKKAAKKKVVRKSAKKVGAVKKVVRKIVKKAAKKKIVRKIVKKAPAKKSAIKSLHTDTRSHNVNIHVMSGISGHNIMDEIKSAIKKVEASEKYALHHKLAIKNKANKQHLPILKKQLLNLKKYITEQKAHIKELKKHI